MTLTSRLSLFFVLALALVLATFSSALYALARIHLHRQVGERLDAALNTLLAVTEVKIEGVEWDATDRQLTIASGPLGEQMIWLVYDVDGQVVATAPGVTSEIAGQLSLLAQPHANAVSWQDVHGEPWQLQMRRVEALGPVAPTVSGGERRYTALILVAGTSLAPVQATLRQLALVLIGLSLLIWLAALVIGRAVCRRALQPVIHMATAASVMDAVDLSTRLPRSGNGDELDDLGRAFNSLLDRLHDSLERQRRFTGDAAHQLRTPLTAMLGQVEVALRRDRSGEDYRQVLDTVQQQADRLRRIVEALLFLARADADAQLPDQTVIELRDWLPTHLQCWTDHPRSADLTPLSVPEIPCCVRANTALLAELLNVLIENACKYSAAGTPIAMQLRHRDGVVELSVQDRGHGIAPHDQAHLFEAFFRSAATRSRGIEGVGLGLAIARRLACTMNGTLHVSSEMGMGSTFTLRLPAIDESAISVSQFAL